MTSWVPQLPINAYREINKKANSPTPETLPTREPIGGFNVVVGPIVRFAGMQENGTNNYRGSILIATEGETAPNVSYRIGAESATEPTLKGTFPSTTFFNQDNVYFHRYTVELTLAAHEQVVLYQIATSPNQYQFFVPAEDKSANIAHFSCNGFSLATDTSHFTSLLWLDVLEKHAAQHYHVMLGNGDQIYSDAVKLHSEALKEWMSTDSLKNKRQTPATPELIAELEHFYLTHYMAWFGQGYWKGSAGATLQLLFPEAMATIPSVNVYDDHDIIDGFGSYDDATMEGNVFKTVGNVAYKYYMIFQHHMSPEGDASHTEDPLWILGAQPGAFIRQRNHSIFTNLGKEVALVAFDCRTERKLKQIITDSTYKRIFARMEAEITARPSTKHLVVMLGVPILYPRLVWLEMVLTSPLLKPLRALAAKGVIAKGLVNEFDGNIEVLDDLNDHWCLKHHKRERNKLIKHLIEFGASHGVRITILSGDVHLACLSRVQSRRTHHIRSDDEAEFLPENDPRLIFNVISSAIVNAPPPDAMATLLNKRSKIHHFDHYTDEDVVPIFGTEVDGSKRVNAQFLNKRNWSDLIIASQSVTHAESVRDEDPERRFPGVSGADIKHTENASYVKYPLYPDTLVTRIYVEKNPEGDDADTQVYEVFVPRLTGKHKLPTSVIKHLTERD